MSKFFTKQIMPPLASDRPAMQEQRTFSPGAYVRPDWLFITFSLFCFWAGGMVKLPQQYTLPCSRQPPHVSSGSSSGREPMSKSAELSGNINNMAAQAAAKRTGIVTTPGPTRALAAGRLRLSIEALWPARRPARSRRPPLAGND